jgi:outer membrane immunogenic protein
MPSQNITAKIEGLYVNLGAGSAQRIVGVTNTGRAILSSSGDQTEFGLVRAGLNYRFDAF